MPSRDDLTPEQIAQLDRISREWDVVEHGPAPRWADLADHLALDGDNGATAGRRVELTSASAIRSERVRWLDPDRIPLRGLIVVAGEKGLGKSIYTNAYLPSKLTRGALEGELKGEPADALLITAEDDWGSVVKPRNMSHGTDLDRLHRVRVLDDDGEVTLTLPNDVALVETQLDALVALGRRVAMIVIDPIGAFLSERTDSHKDAHVRRVLAPLAEMAERRDLAVIVVAHLAKDESKRLLSRVNGSGAFVNASRSVLGFARNPDDPEGEQGNQRVLVHVATNWGTYAPSLAMHVEGRRVEVDDGSVADVGHLVIGEEIEVGVEELQRGSEESGVDTEEQIGAMLKAGPRPSLEVKTEIAAELGCSRKTVERAGARMAGKGELKIDSGGFPRRTIWALIGKDSEDKEDAASVGTSPGTECVPTELTRIPEPNLLDSEDSRDSGDSPRESVATEAEEADAERIAAKLEVAAA